MQIESKETPDETSTRPTVLSAPVNVRTLVLAMPVVICLVFLRLAKELFIPIVVGLLLSFSLDPVVAFLTRLRIPRVIAAAVVLLGVLTAIGAGFYSLRGQAGAVIEHLPEAAQRFRIRMQELRRGGPARSGGDDPISQIQEAACRFLDLPGDQDRLRPDRRVAPDRRVSRRALERMLDSGRRQFVSA